jgi:geranylgeranyl diphosphate synthase type II
MQALQTLVNEAITAINWNKTPTELYEPIDYTLQLGGKRLRPALALAACDLLGGDPHQALPAAVGIELFHNFTLIHDDIMDNAPLRRGQPTVYQKYNTNTAILSGDALFVVAYQHIAQTPAHALPAVLHTFNTAALQVCEGQQLDMNYETLRTITLPQYIEMIALKTSVLLAAAMQIGALIAGANPHDAQCIYDFGKHTGIAFQIQDDILDVFADAQKFGKQIGGDILSNKNTYLKITAYNNASPQQTLLLNQLFYDENNGLTPNQKIQKITELYQTLHVKQQAQAAMQQQLDIAFAAMNKITAPEHKKQTLIQYAQYLVERQE